MECGSRRLAFFGVTFAGVAAAPSLAMCAAAARSSTRREVVVDGAGEWEMREEGLWVYAGSVNDGWGGCTGTGLSVTQRAASWYT